jgi:hypothetical protein
MRWQNHETTRTCQQWICFYIVLACMRPRMQWILSRERSLCMRARSLSEREASLLTDTHTCERMRADAQRAVQRSVSCAEGTTHKTQRGFLLDKLATCAHMWSTKKRMPYRLIHTSFCLWRRCVCSTSKSSLSESQAMARCRWDRPRLAESAGSPGVSSGSSRRRVPVDTVGPFAVGSAARLFASLASAVFRFLWAAGRGTRQWWGPAGSA